MFRNWTVASESETPYWILVLGGAGIVAGLATYGYKIIKVLGIKMAKMTPSRGTVTVQGSSASECLCASAMFALRFISYRVSMVTHCNSSPVPQTQTLKLTQGLLMMSWQQHKAYS